MAPLTPYSYIQCPCSESSPAADSSAAKGEPDDRTFDPRAPRANYSLYPLEYPAATSRVRVIDAQEAASSVPVALGLLL
ncbi:hypothetical protein HYQ45_016336 [Verticillium longisporum]|uniref:Uncharacterized protein n=1 Tax=Verticillium longisporum TaxID=100787 RepID=A0A8I3AJU1_VERLO|nr:hypothetical protein HYQ45_016336 [Verticillium longisporum]